MPDPELRSDIRARYTRAAADARAGGSCCDPSQPGAFGSPLYSSTAPTDAPPSAMRASLGCGNPTAVAELGIGEVVLDLGSGGGLDVILSARRVGPTGTAYGVDALDEMLTLARENAADAGVANVEFLKGMIENVPLPDRSVDVVISNCVVNLSQNKPAVVAEMARLLRPGGRIGISDVVADDHLEPHQRAERGSLVGCIAGALSISELRRMLDRAGFIGITIEATHAVADGMYAANIRART